MSWIWYIKLSWFKLSRVKIEFDSEYNRVKFDKLNPICRIELTRIKSS